MRVDTAFEPLVTSRLRMRRSVPEDAEAIAAYRSNPLVHRYQGWDRTDADGVLAQIREMSGRSPGEPGWIQLTVEELDGGRLVGDVGLSPDQHDRGVIKIGYTIDPEFQGKGYATEAVEALVDYAFDALGASVIRAFASAENLPSIRVAEKVGLTLRERIERTSGGKTWHIVRYELDRDEGRRPRS